MSGVGITFDLIGNDQSASAAIEGLTDKAKKVAGGIGAAFAGMKIGGAVSDAMKQGFDNKDVLAKFSATLGQTPAVAKKAGDLAGQLYRNGIGSSLEDVTNAVSDIGTNMVDLSKTSTPELSKITTGTANLAKAMGVDVVDVTKAAGQMMKNGLAPDAQSALDIITNGMTSGANGAGDLLDTLNEYSPQFSKLGIDGGTATAILKTGLDNGILSTDLAADAFKEFSIRAIDGSTSTSGAYQALGLDASAMATEIGKGGPAAEAATGQVMTALANMKDPLAQNAAGTALFGTQWEDAGPKAILAMNPALQKVTDVTGATKNMGDTMNDTANNKMEVMRRSFQGWLTDVTNMDGPMGTVAAAVVNFGPQAVTMAGSVGMMATAFTNTGIAAKTAAGFAGMASFAGSMVGLASAMAAPLAALAAAVVLMKYIIDHKAQITNTPFNAMHSNDAAGARDFFSGPMMPKFATGGVAMPQNGGFPAVVGDGGEPEAIVPLSKWDAMTGGGGSGAGTTVNVHVTGAVVGTTDQLARVVVDAINGAQRRGMVPANAIA